MRVYAPAHDVDAGRAAYANEISVKIMEAFEEKLNMSYHLSKCGELRRLHFIDYAFIHISNILF